MADLAYAVLVGVLAAALWGPVAGVAAGVVFYLWRVAKRPYTRCWLAGVPWLHRDVDGSGKNWGNWCPACGGGGTRRRVAAVLLRRGKR